MTSTPTYRGWRTKAYGPVVITFCSASSGIQGCVSFGRKKPLWFSQTNNRMVL